MSEYGHLFAANSANKFMQKTRAFIGALFQRLYEVPFDYFDKLIKQVNNPVTLYLTIVFSTCLICVVKGSVLCRD